MQLVGGKVDGYLSVNFYDHDHNDQTDKNGKYENIISTVNFFVIHLLTFPFVALPT